jgi:putative MATE family efflux protein
MAARVMQASGVGPRLVDGDVGPVLRRLTTPMVLAIISMVLFNLADIYFVGLLGTSELAALGFTLPVVTFVNYLGLGLGIGTSATVARVIGEGGHEHAARIATDSLLLAALVAATVVVAGLAAIDPVFSRLGAGDVLLPYIRQYMGIWFGGVPLIMLMTVGNSALRAIGDTRTVSRIMLSAALLNGVLDPLLIFGPGPLPAFGMAGAALATVTAWAAALITALYVLRHRARLLVLEWPGIGRLMASWRMHLRISVPAATANMLTPIGTGLVTAMVAAHGAATVAAYGVVMRIESLALIVVLALSTSLPPFISQNLGAGRIDRVREGLRVSLRFVALWELGVYGLILLGLPAIAALFTDDPVVDRAIRTILCILPLSYGAQGVVILTNSSFNALHAPRNAVLLGLMRWFGCYVPLAWIGAHAAGVPGLFAGAALGNFLIAGIAFAWMRRYLRDLPATTPFT